MSQEMDRAEFGQFVAALWKRQGWQTQIKRDDGRIFVAVQRPETGEEGLLWAVADGEIGGQQVQQFQSLCDEYGVGERAIVTGGVVSDHAEKVAKGTGVELLDGEGIETVLERKGLTDLAKQYRGGGGGGGSGGSGSRGGASDGDSEGSALAPVRSILGRASGLVSGVPVVAVVVVVALLGAGVLWGPPIPFLDGGGDGLSANSTAPADANASLHVTWNAKTTDAIDPNRSDGTAYLAPEGEQFVLVRMTVNNTGNGTVPLEQSAFQFRSNGTTYANETLADHDVFIGFPIGPGETFPVWTVFAIPEGESGELVYDQNATEMSVAVEFERDTALPVNETEM
ncbi:restriction endonuclease [Halorussus litoreus]|uniref:restriction endonuclease n=1 Tax=Halorussus litoreus TaxID=1710536 RepID=UPI000E275CC6|nr:restriction endonuclease [Halorussus litoreus]